MGIRNIIARVAISLKSGESLKFAEVGYSLFYGSREELVEYQTRRLEALYFYAYQHTKYYKQIFDQIGLIQDGKINWSAERNIPILTKKEIKEHFAELISDEMPKRRGYKNTSGGSTGVPVLFYQDKEYFDKNFGNIILMGIINEKHPGDKELKLWGSERDILQGSISFKDKLINWIYNRKLCNSFVMSEKLMDQYCNTINQFQPKQIWTYADSIYALAKYIIQHRIDMFCPYSIISTAGCLYSDMRMVIQQAFPESNILNQYGSREVGLIACEHVGENRLYVFEHTHRVEVLDDQTGLVNKEGAGEILITNLNNYSMPLIRFSIGDEGVLKKYDGKSIGAFSYFGELSGRKNCHLTKSNGEQIHGEYFTHLFYHKDWVDMFQVVQHTTEWIEFKIVMKPDFKNEDEGVISDLNKMISDAKAVMGDIKFTVSFCNHIDRLKSGKYQFVISEVE